MAAASEDLPSTEQSRRRDEEAQTLALFQRFDANQDGRIDPEDIEAIFLALDPTNWSKERVRLLVAEMDMDGDGRVSYAEFVHWMWKKEHRWEDDKAMLNLQGIQKIKSAAFVFDHREEAARQTEFAADLMLGRDEKLGLKVEHADAERASVGSNVLFKSLLITHIDAKGAISMYNLDHYPKIAQGDKILCVNGRKDVAGMKQELKKSLKLKLQVVPVVAGLAFKYSLSMYYKVNKQAIADGMFASVFRATRRQTDKEYAVKSINKQKVCPECSGSGVGPKSIRSAFGKTTPCDLCDGKKVIKGPDGDSFDRWLNNIKDMDHPNVIRTYDVFEDWRCYHLVLELCTGGELFEYLLAREMLTEPQAGLIMKQVLGGVSYMHGKYVCHGDLKPESLLLLEEPVGGDRNMVVKIIDFRTARNFEGGTVFRGRVGEAGYTAPEIVTGAYDHRCDLWSLGVILYLAIAGYLPFQGHSDLETMQRALKDPLQFPTLEWKEVSVTAKELVKGLVEKDPQKRLDSSAAIQSTWIQQYSEPGVVFKPLKAATQNLKRYLSYHQLQKAAMTALAQRLNSEDTQLLRKTWQALDRDGDGTCSLRELKQSLAALGQSMQTSELAALLEAADMDGNRRMNYTEFLAAAMDKQEHMQDEEKCWIAFSAFDHNGTGFIEKHELEQVLAQSQDEDSKMIAEILEKWDTERDGRIDFDEFMDMMESENL